MLIPLSCLPCHGLVMFYTKRLFRIIPRHSSRTSTWRRFTMIHSCFCMCSLFATFLVVALIFDATFLAILVRTGTAVARRVLAESTTYRSVTDNACRSIDDNCSRVGWFLGIDHGLRLGRLVHFCLWQMFGRGRFNDSDRCSRIFCCMLEVLWG